MSSSPRRWAGGERLLAASAALLVPAPWTAGSGLVDAENLTDARIRSAIHAIVDELYHRKDPKDFWEPALWDADVHGQSAQAGGYTPLVVLALLHAGESYQEPQLRDAIEHLEQATLRGTYAVAVRAHVWALLPEKFHGRLAADTRWLTQAFQDHVGGWGYDPRPKSGWYDNSLAQYGALGLWEAAKRGVSVPPKHWQRLEARFLDNQLPDGGWNYRGRLPATGSMTAAGLTALFITQDVLHAHEAVTIAPPRTSRPEEAITRGLQWMDEHFSSSENPGRDTYFFYYLYGVERIGLASGYKTFGPHDWFRRGAAEIINRLCAIDPDTGRTTVHERLRGRSRADRVGIRQLAFGLMFLCRGRVPVAFNKLRIDGLAWNNRPRDVANLTRWVGDQTETALNWQIVSFDGQPEQWLDAPVLYLASHQVLPFSIPKPPLPHRPDRPAKPLPEPLAKLKRYLDLGGLLLAVNEGDSSDFTQSVIRAGDLLYPGYGWRKLPRNHWAYTLLWQVGGKRPVLRGLSNGVRELIILAPRSDLSATLQVRADEPAAFRTAAHVYLYASEMNRPRPRLAAAPSPAGAEPGAAQRGSDAATIVHARYSGNWNPEPLALERFVDDMERHGGPPLRLIDRPLIDVHLVDPRPALVVVTGTDPHELDLSERGAIRAYVEAGGVVLFETVGGRGEFARAAEGSCAAAFDASPDSIRSLARAPIITGVGLAGAARLTRLDYRPYAQEALGLREPTPRLRGMVIDGQPRLLFSDFDISFGLLDQPCWGVAGYAPDSAQALLRNIVLYAIAMSNQ